VTEVPNDTSTGTVVNTLATIGTTGAKKAGSGATSVATYVVVAGAGSTSGTSAQLAISGQAACVMDSSYSNVEGQPVFASTTAGDCSASNWYPLFSTYGSLGVPLELQPIALSYPNDTNCTNGCSPSTYSGDLQTFLWPFAINQGGTDFEIYWRDLSLAYDVNNYCQLTGLPPACTTSGTSITLGGQIPDPTHLLDFFQATGQGDKNPYCSGNLPQGGAKGNCGYQNNIDAAHGQH
jgi:hypothetical protein